ncbi:MAG: helix-turn-helix domain-containing protein [Oscillospiraceae bacterium]|nr:helix-turn-helix domain-containing protein [Oscillospiraceae bacterium]
MELGQLLKQARLDAGLSQRQLCGDTITRNMLSQIENGSARPSMDTLRILAGRLGKPVSYFLEEQPVSPNQSIILQARSASAQDRLVLLEDYHSPDPVFDPERYLLEALGYMELAQTAIAENRFGLGQTLLEQAKASGSQTFYYTPELERRRLLLCYAAGISPEGLLPLLPDSTDEFLLRAQAELDAGDPDSCGRILDAAPKKTPAWYYLRGEAFFAQKDFQNAAQQYLLAPESNRVYARLEQCYRELEDFKNAYFYACKQR